MIVGIVVGWIVTSVLVAAGLARWFKYQSDLDSYSS